MRLISILKSQKGKIGLREKRALLSKLEKFWAEGNEGYSIYATALKGIDPDFLAGKTLDRVKRLKRSKDFTQAEELLKMLMRHSLSTDAIRYELATSLIRNGAKDLSPLRRKTDEGLSLLADLIKLEDFPLLKRLKADKALGPEDLFYIGFHFTERLFQQRDFGIELLKYLVQQTPRSKTGRAAKEKLNLAGITV
jgi:hypothetical protein